MISLKARVYRTVRQLPPHRFRGNQGPWGVVAYFDLKLVETLDGVFQPCLIPWGVVGAIGAVCRLIAHEVMGYDDYDHMRGSETIPAALGHRVA